MWVQRVALSEPLSAALVQMHARGAAVMHPHEVEQALTLDQLNELQFAVRYGEPLSVTALRCDDGLMLRFGGDDDDAVFHANMAVCLRTSKRLGQTFAGAYAGTQPFRVPMDSTNGVADTLRAVCPRWKSLRVQKDEPRRALQVQTPGGDAVARLSDEALAQLAQGTVSDGDLSFSFVGDGPTRALTVRKGKLRLRYEAHLGAFGTCAEPRQDGVYVLGARQHLNELISREAPLPQLFDVAPLDPDLGTCEHLVHAARGMQLSTTFPRNGYNASLFELLGICSEPAMVQPPSEASVFALSKGARMGAVIPPAARAALRKTRAAGTAAVLGAYAVHCARTLFGRSGVVSLNAPFAAEADLEAVTRGFDALHPMASFEWNGEEVCTVPTLPVIFDHCQWSKRREKKKRYQRRA